MFAEALIRAYVRMSFHIHTPVLFIIYSKYVHVYTSVFAQQMPVSGPRDKMKARPLGQKNPETTTARKGRRVWRGGTEREAMGGGDGGMRVEERQSGKVNIYLFICRKETMQPICAAVSALCVCSLK